ncbi:MAG: hypothetical protein WA323_09675 [Candidatus Nitrosopolaris sp.]|jgi:hypothetical protein
MTNQVNDNKQDNKAKIIETAMSFPMDDLLRKYCMEHSLPIETGREHEREIKRFLALSVINSSTKYVMSGPTDELWHSFILFTKKYHEFCYVVAGHYIHHLPSFPNDKPNDFRGYTQLLQDYKVLFGEEPPTQYWPRPQKKSADSPSDGCAPHCVGSVTDLTCPITA